MSIVASAAVMEHARQHKGDLRKRMFKTTEVAPLRPEGNIRGFGYGAKLTAGAGLDTIAVRVYVRAKQPKRNLSADELVPDEINGIPTDVIPVGDIHAAAVPCGVSVGHVKVTAGTLGCLVKRDAAPDKIFILSNNHVLANANAAAPDDFIVQPGVLDGGKPPQIAVLTDFEPLHFDTTKNEIDAAVAELVVAGAVTPDVKVIGNVILPIVAPAIYESVRKHGRTTLHTLGVIMDIAADISVRYGSSTAAFEDQIAVAGVNGWFADRGDSGALVVDAVSRRAVGLLFAVAQGVTFCNPIDKVLARFGATIVGT